MSKNIGGGENVSPNPRYRGMKTSLPRSRIERGREREFLTCIRQNVVPVPAQNEVSELYIDGKRF